MQDFDKNHLGCKFGAGVLLVLMFATVLSFNLGYLFYINLKSESNFLTSFIQAIVATDKYLNVSMFVTKYIREQYYKTYYIWPNYFSM